MLVSLIKIRNFCSSKDTIKKMNKQFMDQEENNLSCICLTKDLYLEYVNKQ